MNEDIAKQQEIMKFKPDVDKKSKKLSKLESKIQNNLDTHKVTINKVNLRFLKFPLEQERLRLHHNLKLKNIFLILMNNRNKLSLNFKS